MTQPLDHIVHQVRTAAASGTPLRIRGGGSKDFLGSRPDNQPDAQAGTLAEILDTRPLAGIVNYEPSELVVTVKAGTPLAELEATLAGKGQCLAFEPPHYQIHQHGAVVRATVGGMVASGLSGPARACVGGVRDYVLGLELLNGRAQLLRFGGTVMKNVAGYDVSRLMVGAMGSLGLITEVSLKVLPFAPAEATLRFEMDEAQAIRSLNTWAGQPLPLNASSWVVDAGVPTLYLRLRGASAAVESACAGFIAQQGATRLDSPETQGGAKADWTAARDLKLPWFTDGFARGDDLWRLSVPPTTPPLEVGDTLADWLGGQRWVWVSHGDAAAAQRVCHVAQQALGSATLFVTNRVMPAGTNSQFHSQKPGNAALDAIQARLKAEFDPAHIYNRGRLPPSL